MATLITEECILCGVCEEACPNTAISEGELRFEIDPARCTECVAFHAVEQCADVCPVDCCIPDPGNAEAENVLFERAKKLHPARSSELRLGPTTSRFRRDD